VLPSQPVFVSPRLFFSALALLLLELPLFTVPDPYEQLFFSTDPSNQADLGHGVENSACFESAEHELQD